MRQVLKHVGRSLLTDSRWHIAMLLSCSVLFGVASTMALVKHALFWQHVKLPTEAAFAPGVPPAAAANNLQTAADWLRRHLGPEITPEEKAWVGRFETEAASLRGVGEGQAAQLAMRDAMLALCDVRDGEVRLRKVGDLIVLRPMGTFLIPTFLISAVVALCSAFLLWTRVRRLDHEES